MISKEDFSRRLKDAGGNKMITTDKIREAVIEQLFNASSFRETIPPRHHKRTMLHMRGQWMTITDRREQYYAKRKAHDDLSAWPFIANKNTTFIDCKAK